MELTPKIQVMDDQFSIETTTDLRTPAIHVNHSTLVRKSPFSGLSQIING